jgi:hypothetical protein
MSYDEKLAERVRRALAKVRGVSEKKMFGGLAFMLKTGMFCGVVDNELMVRVGLADYERALAEPGARPMDFTGRPLKGFVFVGPAGHAGARALEKWLQWGADFVRTLERGDATKKRRKAPA